MPQPTPTPLPYTPRTASSTTTSSRPSTLPQPKRKLSPALLAISIAAITATGAFYGASLKTEHQSAAAIKQRQEAGVEERLGRLRGMRAGLERERRELEMKIEGVRERMAEGGVGGYTGGGRQGELGDGRGGFERGGGRGGG